MGRFDGKVVFITGAARGQGRNHAVRFAQEGADVIAVDVCAQIATVEYPLATPQDLDETVAQVESHGGKIVARQADVRDQGALEKAVREGVAELGRLDYIVANAGVGVLSAEVSDPIATFRDVLDVNLVGVWNTVEAAISTLVEQGSGGSIVLISSTAGLKGVGGVGAGGQAYTASKHGVVGLMRNLAINHAEHNIRVNTIHPTGVATPMIQNDVIQRLLNDSPDLIGATDNLLAVPLVDPDDISNAVLWLCSDEARYLTGVALPVDAGFTIK